MRSDKFILGVGLAVMALVIIFLTAALFRIGNGGEDNWICVDEKWQRHGNPSAAMPTEGCGESLRKFKYQPRQCVETPWDEWYASGAVQFFKAPIESELITAYHSNVYRISVSGVSKLESGDVVCMSCSVCPTSFFFELTAPSGAAETLESLGWTSE
jgi:hypothetical protein